MTYTYFETTDIALVAFLSAHGLTYVQNHHSYAFHDIDASEELSMLFYSDDLLQNFASIITHIYANA